MPPTRLIYVSTRADQTAEAVDAIFDVSQRLNRRDDITGALLVGSEHFVQILEGNREPVSRCMVRIIQDPRHRDVEFVSTNLVPHRLFPQWSLHRINVPALKKNVLQPFLLDGAFQPRRLSQVAIEDLCRLLSLQASRTSPI